MKRYIAGWLAAVWTVGSMLTGTNQPSQHDTDQSFTIRAELRGNTPDVYGAVAPGETSVTESETGNKAGIPIVYTSMDKERGKYSKKVKAFFNGLWGHMGAH
ncbi:MULTISPECIES: hypothetical protein [Paenibacillus]|uniref:Uncharacterized protein n=1 Tax=Paenibacillus borealis TaxID=160799 RepID=A0ABX3HNR5_PAEBO|nr:hypothetical protein [Paenibacillus borealis]OMD51823.1 hypothetical protein BSK56_04145 [Paenibacillus borealis]